MRWLRDHVLLQILLERSKVCLLGEEKLVLLPASEDYDEDSVGPPLSTASRAISRLSVGAGDREDGAGPAAEEGGGNAGNDAALESRATPPDPPQIHQTEVAAEGSAKVRAAVAQRRPGW
ncbi:hypothetical protein E2562_035220 [Oryza meyeriana var. granulata]|uniref:Uncharacterized protein n=1 Tax=Oryza meyeriana var. granulata TaxID=110450 RepID=A0A6G1DR06_9ORYZ|nr:hypothetical protein E2562_035220 [Oryza meyeriana var. granulata]